MVCLWLGLLSHRPIDAGTSHSLVRKQPSRWSCPAGHFTYHLHHKLSAQNIIVVMFPSLAWIPTISVRSSTSYDSNNCLQASYRVHRFAVGIDHHPPNDATQCFVRTSSTQWIGRDLELSKCGPVAGICCQCLSAKSIGIHLLVTSPQTRVAGWAHARLPAKQTFLCPRWDGVQKLVEY